MELTKYIPQNLTQQVATAVFKTKKNSPHLFFGAGLVGVVTSTVLACRATLKLDKTLDEIRNDLQDVQVVHNDPKNRNDSEYYRDMGYVYTRSAMKLGRLYGPSIVVGTVSVGALTGSHVQMTKRNAGLTMALATVSKAYEEYRQRVQESIGIEKERDIHLGVTEETREIEGKNKKVKVKDPNIFSIYARIFDEYNHNWERDSELNRLFLQCQQNWMNNKLRACGHVFLNEVYECLGFEHSSAGAVVGWIYDGEGDGYIDFGMFEAFNADFINNLEKSIVLDFNVDGVIYDKI